MVTGPHARDAPQKLLPLSPQRTASQATPKVIVYLLQLAIEEGDYLVDALKDGGGGQAATGLLGGPHLHELAPTCHEPLEFPRLLGDEGLGLHTTDLAEMGNNAGVEAIGLRQYALGTVQTPGRAGD